ncbi:MAG: hypothetical protein JWP37_1333 [Mucilaginibacter sp.]|nr:hypothetical protein [Mucilaginibacter sp.]
MVCKSCENDHQENYCPECGEKAFNIKQLSLKHFIEETFEGFIHFDNKLFRTIKILITKPGQLSLDHTEGRRVKYMKPVQLFLVVNLIFFFLTASNIFSLRLQNYISYKPFTNYNTRQLVKHKLAKSQLSLAEYEQLFNEKMTSNSKEFIFIFIPFYGLVFFLLFFWRKRFFTEHLVFAVHFTTFILILVLVEFYVLSLPFNLIFRKDYSQSFDNFYAIFTTICISVYLFFAMRKFYKANIYWTIITAVATGYYFFTFIQYYRMLLFFKILYLN